jgi:hypothetical protein
MSTAPGHWRRLAVTLAQHASRILPGARSPWADAMRRELDYIEGDPAALRWALGCVLASYRARLTDRPSFSARVTWRQIAASGVLMVLVGLALQDNAGGQTAPPRPAVDETTCDPPSVAPELRRRGAEITADFVDRPAQAPDTSCCRSNCAHPLPSKLPDIP